MSKYKENECDKLVQQIAVLGGSQWSGLPAECGHHIIHRGSYLWRWRLMNIAPLTVEEHQMTHAKLLNEMITFFEALGQKQVSVETKLKEFVGHTPLQVTAGFLWGFFMAWAANRWMF